MQRPGYPSLNRAWWAVVRADFVHFGDATVIDPGQRVAVTHRRESRRSLRDPITQSLAWAVRDSKTLGALVVRGVGRSQASGNRGSGQSRLRAITGVGQSLGSGVRERSSHQPVVSVVQTPSAWEQMRHHRSMGCGAA